MDYTIDGIEVGTHASEVDLSSAGTVHTSVRVSALLDTVPNPDIKTLSYDKKPYWSIERARIGDSREVPLELVVNGKVIAQKKILADGNIRNVSFDLPIAQSSWVTMRKFAGGAYESHICRRGQEANLCVRCERPMGPGCSSSVVDTEGAAHLPGRDRGGTCGVRSRRGSLQEPGKPRVRRSSHPQATYISPFIALSSRHADALQNNQPSARLACRLTFWGHQMSRDPA
jgi:hypothetical protein